jgi:multidrug resistance protein, MATE family
MSRALTQEGRDLVKLAGPLIAGFAGGQLLGIVDTIVVGRLGAHELAGVSIGTGLFFAASTFGVGTVLGLDPLLSQADGAGEGARVAALFERGKRLALWLSLPIALVLLVTSFLLPLLPLDARTTQEASRFLWGRIPSLPPFLLFVALRAYLQTRGSTRAIAVAPIYGNIANLALNLLLIFGDDGLRRVGLPAIGLPPLGVVGSALASTISSVLMWWILDRASRRISIGPGAGDTAVHERDIWKLGGPIGITLMAEVSVFALASILAAKFGAEQGAAHQVAIVLASLTFIVSLGIGAAASVRVGQAVGRGDTLSARRAGFAGFIASMIFMSLAALMFVVFARPLASLMATDPKVIAAAIPLIHVAALFQISDGLQAVGAGALRGIGDTRFIQRANILGHYAIGLPTALFFGFLLERESIGIWWGLSAGLTAVAVALILRFERLSASQLARV